MKILFCDNRLGGLLGFRIDVIRHFIQQGHEVILVCPKPTTDWDKLGQNNLPKVRIEYVPMNVNGHNPFADLKTMLFYWKLFRKEHPDCIFTYTIKPNIYAGLVARVLRIRTISMIAGLGYAFMGQGVFKRLLRSIYRFSLRHAEKIMVLNKSNYDTLLQFHFATTDQLILLHGGEGANLVNYPYAPSSYTDGVTFLMVSRILYDKGYTEFIEAAKYVLQRNADVKFELLGPTAYDSPMGVPHSVLETDRSLGIINYLGVSEHVVQLLSRPNIVVVLPSYYAEGLNRSLMEACAVGRPIITTDIPGCKEAVDHDKNGYIVPIKDIHALAEAMLQFISLSEEQKRAMAQHSHELAVQRFDVRKVIDVYNRILLPK